MYMVLFQSISNQIMPMFVPQRSLYEVRERPSKIYRWNSKYLAPVSLNTWLTIYSLYPVQHFGGSSLEHFHVRHHLLLLVLSCWLRAEYHVR